MAAERPGRPGGQPRRREQPYVTLDGAKKPPVLNGLGHHQTVRPSEQLLRRRQQAEIGRGPLARRQQPELD